MQSGYNAAFSSGTPLIMRQSFPRKIVFLSSLVFAALLFGTSGYMLIEHWTSPTACS
jgi:ammonia channel protein AmtB